MSGKSLLLSLVVAGLSPALAFSADQKCAVDLTKAIEITPPGNTLAKWRDEMRSLLHRKVISGINNFIRRFDELETEFQNDPPKLYRILEIQNRLILTLNHYGTENEVTGMIRSSIEELEAISKYTNPVVEKIQLSYEVGLPKTFDEIEAGKLYHIEHTDIHGLMYHQPIIFTKGVLKDLSNDSNDSVMKWLSYLDIQSKSKGQNGVKFEDHLHVLAGGDGHKEPTDVYLRVIKDVSIDRRIWICSKNNGPWYLTRVIPHINNDLPDMHEVNRLGLCRGVP